jgi:hypothetical protein
MLAGYRVVIFNAVMALLLVVKIFYPDAPVPSAEDVNKHLDMVYALISFVTVIGNLVLRFFTKTPIFKSGPTCK